MLLDASGRLIDEVDLEVAARYALVSTSAALVLGRPPVSDAEALAALAGQMPAIASSMEHAI